MRMLIAVAALVLSAHARSASAQDPLSNAKKVTQKAVDATNAHTAAEQNPEGKQAPAGKAPARNVQVEKMPAAAPAGAQRPGAQRPGAKLDIAAASDTSGPPPSIMREVYEYARDGRRDPFVSLLTTNELRPTMSDLHLSSILFDPSSQHSVAILRDLSTNAQYRVTTGSTLGRMRVFAIRLKTVVFTIDEFGTTRRDSLVLGDSTKVRSK
jgi:hypothetical protein